MGAAFRKRSLCCHKDGATPEKHSFQGNFKFYRNAYFNITTSATNITNIPINSPTPQEGIHILNSIDNNLVCKLTNKNSNLGKVLASAITSDGKTIVLAHVSHTINNLLTVWNLTTGNFSKEIILKMNESNIKQIVSIGNNKIVIRTSSVVLKVIDLEDNSVRNLYGHNKTPVTVNVLSDGTIISSSKDKCIKTWDGVTYLLKSSYVMPNKIRCLLEFGNKIICGTSSGSLLDFDLNLASYSYLFIDRHKLPITSMTILGNNLIASGSEDTTISIYDYGKRIFLYFLTGHNFSIVSLVALSDNCLASCDSDEQVVIWS